MCYILENEMALQNLVTGSIRVILGNSNSLDTKQQEIQNGNISKQIVKAELFRSNPGNIKHPITV